MLRPPPHLDVKEHLLLLHRKVLPIFFVLCALTMLAIVVHRAGEEGAELPEEGFVPARIGLLEVRAGAVIDPAFAVLSPIEMVLAPEASVFGSPIPPRSIGQSESVGLVRAAADGRVALAGPSGGAQAVILLHERGGRPVESVYAGLSNLRVGVGMQVRRGQIIGSTADDTSLRFQSRETHSLAIDGIPDGVAAIPDEWRGPSPTRLAPPPEGEPIEPSAIQMETPTVPDER